MTKEEVIKQLSTIVRLTPQLDEILEENLEKLDLEKNETLLSEGKICKKAWFIASGLVRSYCTDEETGEQKNNWFMKEGDIVVSVESFFKQRPSKQFLQCLEDTTVYCIDYRKIQELYSWSLEFNQLGRILTEKYYVRREQFYPLLSHQKAQARYKHLLETDPELLNRVPLTMLSSFLGTTRRTLTRIRNHKK